MAYTDGLKYVLLALCVAVMWLTAMQTRSVTSPTEVRSLEVAQKYTKARNWSWVEVFSYVPKVLEDCVDLFPDSKELPPVFAKKYEEYTSSLGFEVTEGYSAMYREEFLFYIKCVQAPFVRTVCETGFNAGHSTFTWLAANPRAHVYSFDIGQHNYSRHAAANISALFPGRFTITWGDSTKILPTFQEQNPNVKCDLMVIDGGHTYDVCKSDNEAFKKMANTDNILILDNYPDTRNNWISSLGTVWEHGKQEGEIAEIFTCHYKEHGFAVGRIIT